MYLYNDIYTKSVKDLLVEMYINDFYKEINGNISSNSDCKNEIHKQEAINHDKNTPKSNEIIDLSISKNNLDDIQEVDYKNETIYAFKLKQNNTVIEIKTTEELKHIEDKIKDTKDILTLLENCENKDKEKYIKKINSYNKQVYKEFEKYNKNNDEIDEETTQDVISIIMSSIDKYFIKQLMTGLYRALNNNKNDSFYISFIDVLNEYLEKNNIYTYEVYPNSKIKETDYAYYKITSQGKQNLKKIINEVERFAYVMKYIDEYEDEAYSICQGEMYI